MGGFAFKDSEGKSLTTSIKKERVKPTLDSFLQKVLRPSGVQQYTMLGSTGKKSQSGDLDIAIGPVDLSDPKKLKSYKGEILGKIQSFVGDENAKLLGQNIVVMYPILGEKDSFVQIDIMFAEDPKRAEWLMSGAGDDGVKGVYRNLLLAFMAKSFSNDNRKITISFPGGLQVKEGDKVVVSRTEDPKKIMSTLRIPGNPSGIDTFEKLADLIVQEKLLDAKTLQQFENYIDRYLKSEETFREAKKAVDYLNRSLNVYESLRKVIRSIIT